MLPHLLTAKRCPVPPAIHRPSWLHRCAALIMLAALLAQSAAGNAQASDKERIEAIYVLADQGARTALKEIIAIGDEIERAASYPVQRHYLKARFDLEMEAGQTDAAKVSVDKLTALAQARNDETGLVMAGVADASLMSHKGNSAAAVVQLNALSSTVERITDPEAQSYYYRSRGNAEMAMGKFEVALEHSLKSLQYAEQQQLNSPRSRLRAMNTLSNVYSAMNNPKKALEILDQALVVAKQHGVRDMLGTLYLNQGGAYASLGRTREYMAANEHALKIARDSGETKTEAVVLNNIGDSWLINQNYPKAESYSRQAIAKYELTGDQVGLATAIANLGFSLMGQGKVAEGAAKVKSALKMQHDANEMGNEEGILAELGRMYEKAELYKEAVATIREQQILSKQLFRADRERSVAAFQEEFDAAQRQKQLELLARENSLKDAEISNQRLQQIVLVLGVLVTIMAGIFVFRLYQRARDANLKLREANEQLEFHSVRDALTGLFNRRSFLELMKKRPVDADDRRRDGDAPDVGLMVLDIDHFKSINDTLGHGAGDAVLVEVARRLRDAVRESDMVTRWGGEEFLVYSPNAGTAHIRNLAERILRAIGATPVTVGDKKITVTVSGGFLTLPFSDVPETECNWEKALQIADMALYLGKVHGRNRAYGVARLLVPYTESLPVLENDISAALDAGMIELVDAIGPPIDTSAPRLGPASA